MPSVSELHVIGHTGLPSGYNVYLLSIFKVIFQNTEEIPLKVPVEIFGGYYYNE